MCPPARARAARRGEGCGQGEGREEGPRRRLDLDGRPTAEFDGRVRRHNSTVERWTVDMKVDPRSARYDPDVGEVVRGLDLTGRVYGGLTVLSLSGRNTSHNLSWLCKTSCGGKVVVKETSLFRTNRRCLAGCRARCMNKKDRAFRRILRGYQAQAASRGIPFNLSRDEFRGLTQAHCFYCGVEPSQGNLYIYNGIDRKDNEEGYTQSNCVSCCWLCNRMKGVLDVGEFTSHIHRVAKHCPVV